MVHKVHPMSSAWSVLSVSCASLPKSPARRGKILLQIHGPELVFGAVEQHAQVTAIHVEEAADFVFVLFFQEDSAKQLAVAPGRDFKMPRDVLPLFLGATELSTAKTRAGFSRGNPSNCWWRPEER